jgi:hypothetical protein
VNNLYKGGEQPADYYEVVARGNTKHWVDLFHAGEYHKIVIDGKNDLRWMREAQKIGFHTKKCSEIYEEELEETVAKYEPLFVPGKWFVRTESVSLKQGRSVLLYIFTFLFFFVFLRFLYIFLISFFTLCSSRSLEGRHGVGPYSSMRTIIESLVTSTATHSCFGHDDSEINVYLFPWLDMKGEKEFRIFVYNSEITGVFASSAVVLSHS